MRFEHTASKQINFKLRESALIVQALKSPGHERITAAALGRVRSWLDPKLRAKVMVDAQFVTGWIYQAIREVCREVNDG